MTGIWEVAARTLAEAGCEIVVGLPADEPGLLDAAEDQAGLQAVVVRDQRVGSFLATGYALRAGKPAVLALTTGPAFTNSVVGLTEAASLCAPVVVITVGVPRAERGRGAFQEVDQQTLARTFAKWSTAVDAHEQLTWALRRAVAQAVNGRSGIAVVELAAELFSSEQLGGLEVGFPMRLPEVTRAAAVPVRDDLDRAADLLASASRAIVLVGGGVRTDRERAAIKRLTETYEAAYLTTASGRGAITETGRLACGIAGLYATPPFKNLIDEADAVLVIGSQLEETVRMGWRRLSEVPLVHLDCDPDVFGRAVEPAIALLGDAAPSCDALVSRLAARARPPGVEAWGDRIAAARQSAMAEHERLLSFEASPVCATLRLLEETFTEALFVQENGLLDLWGYHYPALRASDANAFLTPGEQTTMGFALGAAVGAAIAEPDRPVIAICGDGALGMGLAALPTAAAYGSGLVLVMWDNGGFGWPRLGRPGSTERSHLTDFPSPPPAAEAVSAAGGVAIQINRGSELPASMQRLRAAVADGQLALLSVACGTGELPPAARFVEHAAAEA